MQNYKEKSITQPAIATAGSSLPTCVLSPPPLPCSSPPPLSCSSLWPAVPPLLLPVAHRQSPLLLMPGPAPPRAASRRPPRQGQHGGGGSGRVAVPPALPKEGARGEDPSRLAPVASTPASTTRGEATSRRSGFRHLRPRCNTGRRHSSVPCTMRRLTLH
jgi:hypothetical protein